MVKIVKEADSGEILQQTTEPKYPWGTQLSLGTDLIKNLGAQDYRVGDRVSVTATVVVTAKSVHEREGEYEYEDEDEDEGIKTHVSLELQFVELSLTPEAPRDRSTMLYGD